MKPARTPKSDTTNKSHPIIPMTADLRSRLICSGLELVEQAGAARLSLREVAKHAGVSHMAPYSHFSSKSDLLCGIASAGFSMLRKHLHNASVSGGSPAEEFLQAGLAYIEFSGLHPQLVTLMFGGLIPAEEQTSELKAARGLTFSDLVHLVEAGIAQGLFVDADATTMAFAGWSIAHGFSQLALGGETQEKLHLGGDALMPYARSVISMLIKGLRR